MNREIKFRAWDAHRKVWVTDGDYDITGIDLMGNLIKCHTESCESPFSYYDDVNIILTQFTGLQDKNGKDIYEGDIVQRGVITFSRGKFQGTYYDSNGNLEEDWEDDLYQERNIEVLGNIYENKELLIQQ